MEMADGRKRVEMSRRRIIANEREWSEHNEGNQEVGQDADLIKTLYGFNAI